MTSSSLLSILNKAFLLVGKLPIVWCQINSLQQLDIGSYINLQNIKCNNNQLQNLNLNLCSKLKILDCKNNQIDSLLFSPSTELEPLTCANNNMQFIDLTNCSKLIELSCSDNAYTMMDLSSNPLLEKLTIQSVNPLLSLDLSNNSTLDHLDIQGDFFFNPTQLNYLNLKNGNNQNMSYFNSTMNYNLTCIEVDDANYSNNNWTLKDPNSFFSEDCTITSFHDVSKMEFTISPNPVVYQIQLMNESDYSGTHYSIFSFQGIMVRSGILKDSTLNLEKLITGFYFLKIGDSAVYKFYKL